VAGEGNFTRIVPGLNAPGGYLISVQGWKGMVPVLVQKNFKLERFPELVVDSPPAEVQIRGEAIELRVRLDGGIPFDQGGIVARITAPSGRVDDVIMQGQAVYKGSYLPQEAGTYSVSYETRGAKYLGVEYHTSVQQAFEVTLIPTVHVSAAQVDVPSVCLTASNEVLLSLSIVSSGEQELVFSVPNGWDVRPASLSVGRGQQEAQLRLEFDDGQVAKPGHVEVVITGSDMLEIRPERAIRTDVHIPGFYERCRSTVNAGIGILAVAAVLVFSLRRATRAAMPPLVAGTLRHWEVGESARPAEEIDLTAFKKHALLIGDSAACNVMIANAGLDPQHAKLVARKSGMGIEVCLEPIGEVRKGYTLRKTGFVLQHGDTFRMGARDFQYLSDHSD
jgi:hypothetical protein